MQNSLRRRYTGILASIAASIFFTISCGPTAQPKLDEPVFLTKFKTAFQSTDSEYLFTGRQTAAMLKEPLQLFYQKRDYALVWLDFDKMNGKGLDYLNFLESSEKIGLDPERYHLDAIVAIQDSLFADLETLERTAEMDTARAIRLAEFDFLLSASFVSMASHIVTGRINPHDPENWQSYARHPDYEDILKQLEGNKKPSEILQALEPDNPQYALLKKQYLKLVEYAADSLWQPISLNLPVKPGDQQDGVAMLKQRLYILSYNDEESENGLFDDRASETIKNFQRSHQMDATGIIDQQTLNAVNRKYESWQSLMKLNLDRMRWLPTDFGDEFLLVNIPDYHLHLIKDGEPVMNMRVIVGDEYNETPIFSDTIEYIVFSPTWTVPLSIAREEMLPKMKEDKNYLQDRDMKLYDDWASDAEEIDPKDIKWKKVDEDDFNYKIVESPGNSNALGKVKFMFPNNHAIYLHDTPGRHRFREKDRRLSHGCIRIEEPVQLATYLLEKNEENEDGDEWDNQTITKAMDKDEPVEVSLKRRLPIHIVYWTCWINEAGFLQIRDDIYEFDIEQQKALSVL